MSNEAEIEWNSLQWTPEQSAHRPVITEGALATSALAAIEKHRAPAVALSTAFKFR